MIQTYFRLKSDDIILKHVLELILDTEVGVKSPEHTLVPALILYSAESPGIRAPESFFLETSTDLIEALISHFDLN